MFAVFNVFAGLEAEHARRVVIRHAGDRYPPDLVTRYARSLREVALLVGIVGVLSLIFAFGFGWWVPNWLIFIFAVLALVSTVYANLQQRRIRDDLAGHGVG